MIIKSCMPSLETMLAYGQAAHSGWGGDGNVYEWLRRTPAWRQVLLEEKGPVGLVAGWGLPPGQSQHADRVARMREDFGDAGSVWAASETTWYIINADGTRVGWEDGDA